jgi:hypothetical protein
MTASKIVAAAASGVGGEGLDVDELFHKYVYEGNNAQTAIVNGVDNSGEGGIFWHKRTDSTGDHMIFASDTFSGNSVGDNTSYTGPSLATNNNSAEFGRGTTRLSSFNNNGYTIESQGNFNETGQNFIIWNIRKAPRFFDVVLYDGNGSNRTVNHNLGCVPGCIWVKKRSGSGDWTIWHKDLSNSYTGSAGNYLIMGADAQNTSANIWQDTVPTSTQFSLGTNGDVNANGEKYIAFLWAHNDSTHSSGDFIDGNFGPDADQNIIHCGVYTGGGSDYSPTVDIGFEPQFLIIKNKSAQAHWQVVDSAMGMYGHPGMQDGPRLGVDRNVAKTSNQRCAHPTATGFGTGQGSSDQNTSGNEYIFIAIRKGPLAEPTSSSTCFKVQEGVTGNGYSGSPELQGLTLPMNSDMVIAKRTAGAGGQFANFRQAAYNFTQIQTGTAMNQGSNGGGDFSYKSTDIAYGDSGGFNDSGKKGIFWVWKHAPGFFDSVAYFGNGGNAQTIKHNLGKVPEMIWFKKMNSSGHWAVYHPSIPDPLDYYLRLDSGQTAQADSQFVSSTPTATSVTLGNSSLNNSGTNFYMAMFFGSVDGVSKVGSYTGNGGSQNIDCGFANGSAYVLIKNISAAEHWICFDNVRGIVSGNDPAVYYSLDYAQQTGTDYIDPNNSGFNVASGNNYVNASGDNYIFYAIAA